jgi:hypothetical protein
MIKIKKGNFSKNDKVWYKFWGIKSLDSRLVMSRKLKSRWRRRRWEITKDIIIIIRIDNSLIKVYKWKMIYIDIYINKMIRLNKFNINENVKYRIYLNNLLL